MDIHYETALTDEDRDLIAVWVDAHQAHDIESIAVHERLVSVHGRQDHVTAAAGTAMRQGDLAAELTVALTNMRNIASSPPRVASDWEG